jgi:CDP-glucose 4,6-dehydratase
MSFTQISWKDVPVLVTGGAGFVGSHLAHALASRGARVSILDIKPNIPDIGGHYGDIALRAAYTQGSVADTVLVEEMVRRERFDAVFHLAAEAIVPRFHENPAQGLESNVKGTWVLLDALRKFSSKTVTVIASSDKAYGTHDQLPYSEDRPLQGRNPYDCSKSCTDLIAHMYAHAYGLRLLVTRCGNVYGNGDLNFSRIIPYTICAAYRQTSPVLRSDGSFRRDYIHVYDVVGAYLQCAEALLDGHVSGEAYNFGHNSPMSVLEVVNQVLSIMHATHLAPVIQNQGMYEIRHQYLDARKAMDRLGWQPAVRFEEGLEKTISWYREFIDSHPTHDYS